MWSKFFKSSTCHGISDIHNSKSKKLKLLWILIVLLSSSLLVYLMVRITLRFAKNPTVTSIDSKSMDSMEMPKVLVCQDRQLSLSFLNQKNISDRLADYIQTLLWIPGTKRKGFSLEEQNELDQQYQKLLQGYQNKDVRKLIFEAGPNCSSMFIQCSNGFDDALDCCQNLEEKIDFLRGKCFLFNKLSPQTMPGIGLRVKVRLNLDDYFPSAISETLGLTLKIYPSYNPFRVEEMKIPHGYQALISLEKEVTVLVNSPLSTVCNSSADKDKSACWCSQECAVKKVVDLYGCHDMLLDPSASDGRFFPVCSPKDLLPMEQTVSQVSSSFVPRYKNLPENSIICPRMR